MAELEEQFPGRRDIDEKILEDFQTFAQQLPDIVASIEKSTVADIFK